MRLTEEAKNSIRKLPMPQRFWAWVDVRGPDECWEWRGFLPNRKWKYGCFRLNNKSFQAHRLAYELHHGKAIPKHLFACHTCDNSPCCNPGHIFIGTQIDNLQDMSKKGRSPNPRSGLGLFGERHMAAVLTNEEAEKIRVLYRTGEFYQKALASMFGVCQGTIHNVLHGKHYPDPEYKTPSSFDFLRRAKSCSIRRTRLNQTSPL